MSTIMVTTKHETSTTMIVNTTQTIDINEKFCNVVIMISVRMTVEMTTLYFITSLTVWCKILIVENIDESGLRSKKVDKCQ